MRKQVVGETEESKEVKEVKEVILRIHMLLCNHKGNDKPSVSHAEFISASITELQKYNLKLV